MPDFARSPMLIGLRGGDGRPPWRLKLHHRASRTPHYLKRGFARQRTSYFDTGRVRRAIFALWKLWTQCRMLHEAVDVAERRQAGLLVRPQPWWEAED